MKICDVHNDFLTGLKTKEEKINYLKKNIINNKKIKKINCIIWTTKLKNIVNFLNENQSLLKEFKKNKFLISIEDLGFITKSNKINFKLLNMLLSFKIFSCCIVWNNDNNLGGGAYGGKGLTQAGKIIIKFLESNKILIDTAHMNRRTFYDFIKLTTKPIFNSHSNIYNLKKHKRNLTDRQIKTIIDSNGFIGLSFVSNFISDKKVSVDDIARQIKYFADKYGCNNFGIGSDFFGTNDLPFGLATYNDFTILRKKLIEYGLTRTNINKIFYKNFLDFKKRIN